jgi:hypothetical protein
MNHQLFFFNRESKQQKANSIIILAALHETTASKQNLTHPYMQMT